MNIDMGGFSD